MIDYRIMLDGTTWSLLFHFFSYSQTTYINQRKKKCLSCANIQTVDLPYLKPMRWPLDPDPLDPIMIMKAFLFKFTRLGALQYNISILIPILKAIQLFSEILVISWMVSWNIKGSMDCWLGNTDIEPYGIKNNVETYRLKQ